MSLLEQQEVDTARFRAYGQVDPSITDAFRRLAGPRIQAARGGVLRAQGSANPAIYVLHEGWVTSGVVVAGGARQIVKIHMPGDMMGMPSFAGLTACETLQACTAVEASVVPFDAMARIFREEPALAAFLFLITQEERAALMDRLASVGRTGAINRVATLILELHKRLLAHRPDTGDEFEAPLTQEEIADVLGLTGVHVNRTLRALRARGIAEWRHGRLRILDRDALRGLGRIACRERGRHVDWINGPGSAPAVATSAA